MTGRLVKQATLVRQSSLHLINKKMRSVRAPRGGSYPSVKY
jgi:hypothetical protein